ncbi:hypothetical protein Tco_1476266 [Tanacetum coccineum]
MANFPRLDELAVAANYRGLFNGMLVYFDRENGKGLDFANGLHDLWAKLLERTNESTDLSSCRSKGVVNLRFIG